MNYKIKQSNIFIFLTLIGVLSIIGFVLIGFNGWKNLKDKTAEKDLKEFHKLFEEGKPYYTLDQANKIVRELIPKIEKIAGRKFNKIPEIRLINTKEFKKVLIRETDIKILNNSNRLIENKRNPFQIMVKLFYGIYGSRDHILYLLPKKIATILRLLKLDEKYGMDIVRITIAHELTHALQDQYLNLFNKRIELPGTEEVHAFSATIEGHAVFIEKEIGRQLGIDDFIIDLFPLADSAKMRFDNPKLIQMMTSDISWTSIYSQGEKFIAHHYKKGGNRLLWKILENPPIDTSMIVDPKTYSPKLYDYLNYNNILENLYNYNDHYKNHKFTYENISLSKFDLSIMFRNIDFPQKSWIISKVQHYQFFSIYSYDTLLAQITFILLEDSQYTSQYISLREKFIQHNFQNIDSYINKDSWKDIYINKNCLDSIDFARQTSITLEVIDSSMNKIPKKNIHTVVGKKNMVIIHNDGAFNLTPCDIGNIFSKIFKRYQKAKNKKHQ